MDIIAQTIALALFVLISSITPGPNNFMLMASGANFGIKRTIPHIAGVCTGVIIMIFLLELGISHLLETYPVTVSVLKILCSAYLIYLAYKIANAHPISDKKKVKSKPFNFTQACLFQWINPKAWAMGLSILSVYRFPAEFEFGLILTTLVFICVNLPCITLWTAIGTRIKQRINNQRNLVIFNRVCAAGLLATLIPILS